MIRFFVSVLTGLMAGGMVMFLGNMLIDLRWAAENNSVGNDMPNIMHIIRIATHAIGSFIAGLVASLVSIKSKYSSGITALLITLTSVTYFVFVNELPSWVSVSDISISAILGFLGLLLGASRNT